MERPICRASLSATTSNASPPIASTIRGPWWFYLPVVAGGLLPWTPLALVWLRPIKEFLTRRRDIGVLELRLLLWALIPLFFYTLSIGKQPRYVLPVLPPLAILLAASITERQRDWRGLDGSRTRSNRSAASDSWIGSVRRVPDRARRPALSCATAGHQRDPGLHNRVGDRDCAGWRRRLCSPPDPACGDRLRRCSRSLRASTFVALAVRRPLERRRRQRQATRQVSWSSIEPKVTRSARMASSSATSSSTAGSRRLTSSPTSRRRTSSGKPAARYSCCPPTCWSGCERERGVTVQTPRVAVLLQSGGRSRRDTPLAGPGTRSHAGCAGVEPLISSQRSALSDQQDCSLSRTPITESR